MGSFAVKMAIFQICVCGMISLILSLGIFSISITGLGENTAIGNEVNSSLPTKDTYTPTSILSYVFGDFLRMFTPLFTIIQFSLFPTYLFNILGIDYQFLDLLGLLCTLFYALAVIEFIANRKVTP